MVNRGVARSNSEDAQTGFNMCGDLNSPSTTRYAELAEYRKGVASTGEVARIFNPATHASVMVRLVRRSMHLTPWKDRDFFNGSINEAHLAKPTLLPQLRSIPAHQNAVDLPAAMVKDRYGCFNRLDYVESYRAVDSKVLYGDYAGRTSHVIDIPTTAETKCQFTLSALGVKDPRCAQCVHNAKVAS